MQGIVFGASGTLGQTVIKKAASLGHQICGVSHNILDTNFSASDIYYTNCCDVCSCDEVESAFAYCEANVGFPDYVISCVGITYGKPLIETPLDEWKRVWDINCLSAFVISQAYARKAAVRRSAGSIVLISSGYAERHVPGMSAYSASKAGLTAIGKVLSVELVQYRIRINTLTPGLFPSKMTEPFVQDEKYISQLMNHIPDGQLGNADDLAEIALFLCNPCCSHINGTNIVVDGGMANLFWGGNHSIMDFRKTRSSFYLLTNKGAGYVSENPGCVGDLVERLSCAGYNISHNHPSDTLHSWESVDAQYELSKEYEGIVVLGGDGTKTYILNRLIKDKKKKPFIGIAAGTMNVRTCSHSKNMI